MAGKYIKLSNEQKDELRRLTQLANRRIKAAFKAYEKEGMEVAPYQVTGGIQIKEQWNSKNYALSRSVKFTSESEYKARLQYLREFDPKANRNARPTMKQYTAIQRTKTTTAIETALGQEVPDQLADKLNKLTAPQLSQFWKRFDENARQVGTKYNSNAVMSQTLQEFFPEDMAHLYEEVT